MAEKSQEVVERIFVRGKLVLNSPTAFGNGDSSGTTDMPLLYDSIDKTRPLLTGASIAGALRSYLRSYQHGFGWAEDPAGNHRSQAERLFGHLLGGDENASVYSKLSVDDAIGQILEDVPVEMRDGVALDRKTRTALDKKKFDLELLPAGTTFDLNFELALTADDDDLVEALAIALNGLEQGEIGLGRRKRRGFGQCQVTEWQVNRYRMDDIKQVIGWLNHQFDKEIPTASDILTLLKSKTPALQDNRRQFSVKGTFIVKTPLLIRSDSGDENSVDMVHLRSRRNGEERPVISGTSLAGVLRQRAFRIANTVKGEAPANKLTDAMFGNWIEKRGDEPTGSRVIIQEAILDPEKSTTHLIQNRVKIDRFTSGAYPQALFSQQPLFPKGNETTFQLSLDLRQPYDLPDEDFYVEIGLLLLVLKDLWTGDLPIGGESSVGRGRLAGVSAKLTLDQKSWTLVQNADGTLSGISSELEGDFLQAFNDWRGR